MNNSLDLYIMKFYIFKNEYGFTLIEMLIALLVFSSALIALIVIAGRGIISAQESRQQITANFLAQEIVEVARNIRDSNYKKNASWFDGLDMCVNARCAIDYNTTPPSLLPCTTCELYQDGIGRFNAQSGTSTEYIRYLTITENTANQDYLIIGTTSWKNKTITRQVSFSTLLTYWR